MNKKDNVQRAWINFQALCFFAWKKNVFPASRFYRLLHYFLIPFSLLYQFFFILYRTFILFLPKKNLVLPVISVGNVSVGGTGKSLLVAFLVRNFSNPCAAILLRGHKKAYQSRSVIASLGHGLLLSMKEVGDEAAMHATTLSVPVVVGSLRESSAKLLASQMPLPCNGYFLLDDGYQQFRLKKACNILVMDARSMWGNGWTIPAGMLREYDLSRADIIVFSHAKTLSLHHQQIFKEEVLNRSKKKISCFFGYHKIEQLYQLKEKQIVKVNQVFDQQKVALVAGIGSFEQFFASVELYGLTVQWHKEFPDHYQYSLEDLIQIMHAVEKLQISSVFTTMKDWMKIFPLLSGLQLKTKWMIVDCSFDFITLAEKEHFLTAVKECLEMHVK